MGLTHLGSEASKLYKILIKEMKYRFLLKILISYHTELKDKLPSLNTLQYCHMNRIVNFVEINSKVNWKAVEKCKDGI